MQGSLLHLGQRSWIGFRFPTEFPQLRINDLAPETVPVSYSRCNLLDWVRPCHPTLIFASSCRRISSPCKPRRSPASQLQVPFPFFRLLKLKLIRQYEGHHEVHRCRCVSALHRVWSLLHNCRHTLQVLPTPQSGRCLQGTSSHLRPLDCCNQHTFLNHCFPTGQVFVLCFPI